MNTEPSNPQSFELTREDVQAMRAKRGLKRRRRRRRLGTTVNIAPMIDVSFLLLIFFLVTTTFERAEGILSSNMPKEQGDQASIALPISPIVVRIQKTGTKHDDFSIRIDRFNEVPQSFDALPEFLRGLFTTPGFDEETPIVIVASDNVPWDHVVACWNAVVRAGSTKIAFAEP
jgi:biopolymer transport protein ExbD